MTYQVVMDIEFVSGILKGLRSTQKIPFASRQAAMDYATFMDGRTVTKPIGGSPYAVLFTDIVEIIH